MLFFVKIQTIKSAKSVKIQRLRRGEGRHMGRNGGEIRVKNGGGDSGDLAVWGALATFADLSKRNKMNQKEINALAESMRRRAAEVLDASGIARIWREAGCRVNIVGSLRMGLLAAHRDIDLHVYSAGVTTAGSFAVMARVAADPRVTEIRCINGLATDEHCIAWHVTFRADDDLDWQIDIIHIEEGTRYDGYFERMADRILEVMTPARRDTILRLKFETPADRGYHGVEYYEAVIADGVTTLADLDRWVTAHRARPPYYWIP